MPKATFWLSVSEKVSKEKKKSNRVLLKFLFYDLITCFMLSINAILCMFVVIRINILPTRSLRIKILPT
jgi:hypothetical protein